MKYLLVDSCFWFAYLTPEDQYHDRAVEMFDEFANAEVQILVPFPSLYETLNTDFVDHKERLFAFDQIIQQRERVILIDDANYKAVAYSNTVHQYPDTKVSLVDNIIIEIAKSGDYKIDAIVSFNERDFAQFCGERGLLLSCYPSCF